MRVGESGKAAVPEKALRNRRRTRAYFFGLLLPLFWLSRSLTSFFS